MSTKNQAQKNLKLGEKLADFLINNPRISNTLPDDASLITFSADDENLNKANTELIKGLLEEGKHVVKAEETKNIKNPWKFTTI
jgi:hypothetical protein